MKRFFAAAVAVTTLTGVFVNGGSLTAGATETTDPAFIGWSNLLPALTSGYEPSSEDDCLAGKISCVDRAIKEMRRRFEPMAKACDHNAVFGLAYLRTTQTYRWAATTPGFFEDAPFVNHQDIVFAAAYFDAYDNWVSGDRDAVPAAWRIALDAGKAKEATGGGNVFLGMGAHINRDLPYVLAAIGLVKPDGSSRKTDHDKVNEFLNAVTDPLMAEVAARFDPTVDDVAGPALLGYTTAFQMLAAWREIAWRNAERLVNAPDAAARAVVERSIEDYAASVNTVLAAGLGYGLLQSSAARDRHCAANNGAAAPIAYKFGIPEPF